MLCSIDFADFVQEYAKFFLTIKKQDQALFARLMWFTTETGLIQSSTRTKILGSSIISSYAESIHCLKNTSVVRKSFELINVFREPYRADLLQKVYYVLNDFNQLFSLLDNTAELHKAVAIARRLGEFPALFPIEQNKYINIGHCVE